MSEPLNLAGLPARATPIMQQNGTRVHHLPDWSGYDDPKKLEVIRYIAQQRGRDPRIAKLAVDIIKKAKVPPRDYRGQAAALLKWVQDPKNVYYVNEPGERLQDPIYTIRNGFGDCDDQVMVLCALFESVRLPWRLVISGRHNQTKQKVRFIEGGTYPKDVSWAHIYCIVGDHSFQPKKWYFCEATVPGVPLGWDVIAGDPKYIPEMDKAKPGPPVIVRLKSKADAEKGHMYGHIGDVASSVSSAVAEEVDDQSKASGGTSTGPSKIVSMASAVAIGVGVSVTTQLVLDWIRGQGVWHGRGPGFARALHRHQARAAAAKQENA